MNEERQKRKYTKRSYATPVVSDAEPAPMADAMNPMMIDYAHRVWRGQSINLPHAERVARVVAALAAQGYTDSEMIIRVLPEVGA